MFDSVQNGVYFFNPRLRAAVEYYQTRLDRSGELMWSFIHSHQNWAQDIWMFAGTLRDLGLHRDQHDGISPAALRRELRTDRKMCANVLPISRSSLQAVKNWRGGVAARARHERIRGDRTTPRVLDSETEAVFFLCVGAAAACAR